MKKRGIYWVTNDFRVKENPLLNKTNEVDELAIVHYLPGVTPFLQHYAGVTRIGRNKDKFIKQTIYDFNHALQDYGQKLHTFAHDPFKHLYKLISSLDITHLYCDDFAGWNEKRVIEKLTHYFPNLKVVRVNTRMLFDENNLPLLREGDLDTFSKFRKRVESSIPLNAHEVLFSLPKRIRLSGEIRISGFHCGGSDFVGGEQAGLNHLERYFEQDFALHYKQTRNALEGEGNSTQFSPWLALGCVSPQTILRKLRIFEACHGTNDSTAWIEFELLWREYFYWYSRKHGSKLFKFSGIKKTPPLTSFYAQRFQQWKQGATAFPLVNACMRQLNQTGFMSNRGRQIVASCLVNELQLDWRYGAAYFETQLIDYDVSSNWGNWQYLAGVGADPRGLRRFDIAKQTELYDPERQFIMKWCGSEYNHIGKTEVIDSVDMVDWPVKANMKRGLQ